MTVHLPLRHHCLRADVSYFLCCTRKRDVCVTPSLIVFQRPAGFPRSWKHAVIGWHTVRIVWLNADWLLSNLDWCGDLCNRVFQPKQIKTCANLCRTFEILCKDTENLTSAKKLFLYNLLCMTHHIIFVNSVWENYKSGVDFALGRHFGESQSKKLKSLFSPNKQRSKKI